MNREPAPEPNVAVGLVEAGWLLAALLTPLAVNLWASQPFELPKATLFRSLVWIMAGAWLAGRLVARRPVGQDLRGNSLLWPALAVAGTTVLAAALGVDPGLSLWGSYERAQGVLTLLSYVLLFVVVSAGLRTRAQIERLRGMIVATGVPLVGLGLAQALGWQPVPLVSDARSPAYATLGRSNFLGAYLAMVLPLTLAWVWTARRRGQRLAGALLALAELAVIGLTLARGAWLAAGVALAVLAGVGAWLRWRRTGSRWPRVAGMAGAVVALAAGLAVGIGWGQAHGAAGGSTAARLAIWRATVDLIARRPVLGYGPEALGLVFPRVYPPELVYYQGRGLVVDRAHNLVLDGLATTGAVGLVAQMALLVAFAALAWRAAARPDTAAWQRAWLVACLAAIAGQVAGNLVSFDVTATATLAALVMALAVALARRPGTPGLDPRQRAACRTCGRPTAAPELGPGQGAGRGTWGRPAAAALLVAAVGVAVVQANVRPLAADVAARAVERRAALGDWRGAAAAGELAVRLWPVEPSYRRALSYAYLQTARAAADPRPLLVQAEAELLAARDLRPGDWQVWAALGELYGVWGNRWDPARLALAHAAYEQAAARAPQHAMLYAAWGMVDLEGGRYAGAAARFRQAVDLDVTDGYAFWHLGDAELAQGHLAEALVAYQAAVRWAPELSAAQAGLARCYRRLALERGLPIDPADRTVRAQRSEMGAGP